MTAHESPDPRFRTETARPAPAATTGTATTASVPRPLPALHGNTASLLLRVTLGVVFFPHGAQKVFGWFGGFGYEATLASFEQTLNVPEAMTILVMAAELLGSICLVLGLLTRFAALGIAAVMIGAIFLVHWQNGFFMDWQNQKQGEGYEYHLLAAGAALALVALGPGHWSLDRKLWRRRVRTA